MGKILHVLLNKKGLDRYPSVYNALYCWSKLGWSNYIIASDATEDLNGVIEKEYRFSGGYLRRATQLAHLPGYFDIVIVYDPQDLAAFYGTRWLLPRNSYGKLVHHCLEIPTGTLPGGSLFKKALHKMFAGGYRLIDHLIIQDERRAELFFNTFPHLTGLQCFLVTNSFINAIEPIAPSLDWFDQLRAKSNLLVLYIGTIDRWAFSENVIETILKVPEVTFVFSGWSEDGYAAELTARYKSATNIHFHIGAKSRPALNYMVANSDIGLVCYESMDQNVRQVGLASGKMHKFLSFQKPVLMNRIPSLHDFITLNGFGKSVPAEDFSRAIRHLADNYARFCQNINNRYSTLCDYEREYMAFIQALLNRAQEPDHTRTCVEAQAY